MYTFYADDSYLKWKQSNIIEDTLIFGGILISSEEEKKIIKNIAGIKSRYKIQGLPLKWNIKDCEKEYKDAGQYESFEWLRKESCYWRKEIIQLSLSVKYTIIICGGINHSNDKKRIVDFRSTITRYVFANLLQRLGMQVKQSNYDYVNVNLDWPTGNQHHPFTEEYKYAFNSGFSKDNQKYYCGSLLNLNFKDTVTFSLCKESAMLQFTDLIVGATKDYLDTVIKGREYSFGYECANLFLHRFRGYPNNILSYGLHLTHCGQLNSKKLFDAINATAIRNAA
jgi:hypothetical protein